MDHCVECNVCHQWYDITMNSQRTETCNKCYMKKYYEKNKERMIQKACQWSRNNKEKTLRSKMITKWKRRGLICEKYTNEYGLICDKYDQVYQLWLDSTHCDKCGCQYTKGNHKDMEHCHTTGRFRAIVCHKCNMNMLDLKKRTDNTSGHKNISYCKVHKTYRYRKTYYGKTRTKYLKTLSETLCWKYIMLLRLKAGHFD